MNRLQTLLVAVFVMAIVTGCAAGTPVASQPAVVVPDKLVIAITGDGDTLDVLRTTGSFARAKVGVNVAETLSYLDPKTNEFKPLLAEKWEQVDDLHWRVQLKKGLKFSNGREMTVEDAVASITWAINDNSAFWKAFISTATGARAIDSSTFEITTKVADPIFYRRLSYVSVLPKETLSEAFLATQIEGTGPYKLVKWQRGQNVLLERNDNYWGQKPLFKTVEFIIRPETIVAANAVKAGEAQIAFDLSAEHLSIVPKAIKGPSKDVAGMIFNTVGQKDGGSIMQDKRVRIAVNNAIDRQAVAATIFGTLASLPLGQYNPQSVLGTDPELKDYPYDVAAAKALIKDAGAEGKPIVIGTMFSTFPKSKELSEAVAGYLTAIGLQPKIQVFEYAQWLAAYQSHNRGVKQPYDLLVVYHGNEFFESSMKTFDNLKSIAAGGGNFLIADPAIDRLVLATTPEKNPAKRLDLMRQVWRIFRGEAYALPIAVPEVLNGANEHVQWEPRADQLFYVAQVGWK